MRGRAVGASAVRDAKKVGKAGGKTKHLLFPIREESAFEVGASEHPEDEKPHCKDETHRRRIGHHRAEETQSVEILAADRRDGQMHEGEHDPNAQRDVVNYRFHLSNKNVSPIPPRSVSRLHQFRWFSHSFPACYNLIHQLANAILLIPTELHQNVHLAKIMVVFDFQSLAFRRIKCLFYLMG